MMIVYAVTEVRKLTESQDVQEMKNAVLAHAVNVENYDLKEGEFAIFHSQATGSVSISKPLSVFPLAMVNVIVETE